MSDYYGLSVFTEEGQIYDSLFDTLEKTEQRLEKLRKELKESNDRMMWYRIVQNETVSEGEL